MVFSMTKLSYCTLKKQYDEQDGIEKIQLKKGYTTTNLKSGTIQFFFLYPTNTTASKNFNRK